MLLSKSRFIAAMGGKRGGKTTGGCWWMVNEVQNSPNQTQHLIAAPTYDQLNASVLNKFFMEFPQLRQYYKKQNKVIELPGEKSIFCRSLDQPQHVEGLNLTRIWVDEADGLNKPTWDIVQSRTGTTLGRILLTSSVYPSSWMYEEQRVNPDLWEVLTWESIDNPAFPKEEWDRLRRVLPPDQFAREYQSQFIFGQGSILGNILKYGKVTQFPKGVVPIRTWIGLDFGFSDPTAIVVIQLGSNGSYYVTDEYYSTGMVMFDIEYWLGHYFDKYTSAGMRVSYTFVDGQAAIPKNSLPPRFNLIDADKSVGSINKGISLMRNLIQQEKFFYFAHCTNFEREAREWSWEARGIGNVPEDRNNHAIDAARYAISSSYPMIQGIELVASEEQILSPFWERRKEEGVLRNGKFSNKIVEEDAYESFADSGEDYF